MREPRTSRRSRSTRSDAVVGVSASGRTPYALGAVEAAAARGALTAALVSVEKSELGRVAEHEIAVVVGPEFIAGSTRLKAGTAQKLVLNMISTISMVRLGKTFGNLMVDVAATNEKLQARVRRIVETATGASAERVDDGARGVRRKREGRDRLAARGRRCRYRPGSTRRGGRQHETRTGRAHRLVRLGVESALVDGRFVRGDVEIDGDRIAGRRPRVSQRARVSRFRASSTCR